MLISLCVEARAQKVVTLGWDPAMTVPVAGYKIYYGNASHDYSSVIDVGANTSGAISNLIGGTNYYFAVSSYLPDGSESAPSGEVELTTAPMDFFINQASLTPTVDYLALPDGFAFGYYSETSFPWVYHFDMGYEYLVDAADGQGGAYFYDLKSQGYFYTNPQVFPYLYSYARNAWFYYYPDTSNPGHYTSNPRWFYDFGNNRLLAM